MPNGPTKPHLVRAALDAGLGPVLAARVAEHRLGPPYVEVLRRIDEKVPDSLEDSIAAARAVRLRAVAALGRLGGALDAAEVTWAAVKGPVVAAAMEFPEHRVFNDLDLLVAGPQFAEAVELIIAAGGRELNRNWDAYVRHEIGEVPMFFGDTTIDLHWTLVGYGRCRRTMHLEVDAMLQRTRRTRLGEIDVATLDAEDGLLHLCLHCALAGATRLDQLRDIAVAATSVNWNDFNSRAHRAGISGLVAHALDRSARILSAPVPAVILRALGGRSLKPRRAFDAVGSAKSARLRAAPVVASRDSWRNRRRATTLFLSDRALARLGRQRGWDFTDEHGELYAFRDSGGAAARQEFLAMAAGFSDGR